MLDNINNGLLDIICFERGLAALGIDTSIVSTGSVKLKNNQGKA